MGRWRFRIGDPVGFAAVEFSFCNRNRLRRNRRVLCERTFPFDSLVDRPLNNTDQPTTAMEPDMPAIGWGSINFDERIRIHQQMCDVLIQNLPRLPMYSPEWQQVQQDIRNMQQEIKSLEDQKQKQKQKQFIIEMLQKADNIRPREAVFLEQLLIDNMYTLSESAFRCRTPNEFITYLETKWAIDDPVLNNQVKNLFSNLVPITRNPKKATTVLFKTESDKYQERDLEGNGIELLKEPGELSTEAARNFVAMLNNARRTAGYHGDHPPMYVRELQQLLARQNLTLEVEQKSSNEMLPEYKDAEGLALYILAAVRSVPKCVTEFSAAGVSEYAWNVGVIGKLLDQFVTDFPRDRDVAGPYHIYFESQ